jgi:ParB family transcriptional regulator, chromosome partitioning protein
MNANGAQPSNGAQSMLGDKKRALGRGLGALIPQAGAGAVPVTGELPQKSGVLRLPIEAIRRDSTQPRKIFDEAKLRELADSIKAQGLIQPILVRKDGDGYRIIAGERRWRAAQLAGLQEVPAIVREASDAEAFELALVENLQRTDLNPIEEAEGYRRLLEEFSLTQEQVSQRVGKERSSVANALRLLSLPEEVKGMLADGSLNMGHARALLGLSEPERMLEMASEISSQKLSVRETERLVRQSREPAPAAASPERAPTRAQSAAQRQVVEEAQRLLGTKVRLVDRGGKGTLEIEFFSYEDLDRLLTLFRK